MISEIVAINVLSEPGAISKLTFRPSLGQHSTIALNLFAIHRETFFRWTVFQRILPAYNFFRVKHHLRFFLRLSLSWGTLKYWYVRFERVKGWKSLKIKKKTLKKYVKISFFNTDNILLLYLSVTNTTFFKIF